MPNDLRKCLKKLLRTIKIECCCPRCKTEKTLIATYNRTTKTICICDRGFKGPAVLFHELIHACGGTELDAEAFENNCFGSGDGAHGPKGKDFWKFVSENKRHRDQKGRDYVASNWIIWRPKTGEKWINNGDKDNPKPGKKLKFRNPKKSQINCKNIGGGHHPYKSTKISKFKNIKVSPKKFVKTFG